VGLDRPIEVGPRPLDSVRAEPPSGRVDDGANAGHASSQVADAVRTIREYVPGDPIKLVNWAATARAGEVMVKELESPVAPAVVISVDLGRGGEAAEHAASRAAAIALSSLQLGLPVFLLTAEAAGPRSGPVTSAVEVGRRLARAVPGTPAAPAGGVQPIVVSA